MGRWCFCRSRWLKGLVVRPVRPSCLLRRTYPCPPSARRINRLYLPKGLGGHQGDHSSVWHACLATRQVFRRRRPSLLPPSALACMHLLVPVEAHTLIAHPSSTLPTSAVACQECNTCRLQDLPDRRYCSTTVIMVGLAAMPTSSSRMMNGIPQDCMVATEFYVYRYIAAPTMISRQFPRVLLLPFQFEVKNLPSSVITAQEYTAVRRCRFGSNDRKRLQLLLRSRRTYVPIYTVRFRPNVE